MWILFAIFSAIFLALRRVYEKELTAQFGNFSLSFATLAFSLPFLLLLALILPGPADVLSLPWRFWWPLLIIWFVLYPFQNYFLYRSLREGELSEVTPISSLLPILNLAPSFFLLHEVPSLYGFFGIGTTVVATYLLLTDVPGGGGRRYNFPVLFMLLSVACTAIGSTLDKVAIEVSAPALYVFINVLGASILFLALSFLYGQKGDFAHIKRTYGKLVMLGIVFALAFVAFATAFTLGPTSYTLAIRSGGFLIAALWGIFFLKESLSRKKIVALALFTIGTAALAIG